MNFRFLTIILTVIATSYPNMASSAATLRHALRHNVSEVRPERYTK
jgi:hypothetical protein